MGIGAIIVYIGAILSVAMYLVLKVNKRKYVFSCFNIQLYIYFFAFLLTPIFYYSDLSWIALRVWNAEKYWPYLNKCVVINGLGIIVMVISLILTEFRKKENDIRVISRISGRIKDEAIEVLYWGVIALWYIIVFTYNHGIPLLNGGRTFYNGTSISPIYLALNEMILIYSLFYGIRAIYEKRGLAKWALATATLLFTGTRSTFLISALVPIGIVFAYKKLSERKQGTLPQINKKRIWKATNKIVLLIICVAIVGIMIQFVRTDRNVSVVTMMSEFFYGNTFSDIRDGAYIINAFEAKIKDGYLWGKTYLAGLMSFVPSSLSEFRTEWSWGRFTTMGLFGWQNHFGLRGGYALEPYVNFGYLGVIIFSSLQGVVFGTLERMFYKVFLAGNVTNRGKEYLVLQVISRLIAIVAISSTIYNLYVDIIFIGGIIILSSMIGFKFKRRRLKFSWK